MPEWKREIQALKNCRLCGFTHLHQSVSSPLIARFKDYHVQVLTAYTYVYVVMLWNLPTSRVTTPRKDKLYYSCQVLPRQWATKKKDTQLLESDNRTELETKYISENRSISFLMQTFCY